MSPLNKPQPEPPPNEELVAYLDGELTPEECRAVEERLTNDVAYRQQLHDLDQAWEALNALPTSTVDDAFARTTIELACVAAEEDVSQRKSLVAAANRHRRRWWIAGAVAAGMMGFALVRALAVHHNNAQLADLPLIQQSAVLAQIDSIDFLKQLSQAVTVEELARDKAAFNTALADFQQASSPSLSERRHWVNSLSPEQKLNLADSARAFANATTRPEEKDRQRQLVDDLHAAPELQKMLIAYAQWLSRLTVGERDQMRDELRSLSATNDKVAAIQRHMRQEARQLQHLSAEDRITLRSEIVKLAEEKSKELQQRFPPEGWRRPTPRPDEPQIRPALAALGAMLRNQREREAMMNQLVDKLSLSAQQQWRGLPGDRERVFQFFRWLRDLHAIGNDEELEQFFASENVSRDERQRLLEMRRDQMKDRLERMYLESEFGLDWPEFFEGRRGPGGFEPGPGGPGRRGNGPRRSDGPPPGPRDRPGFGPGGPPRPDGPPPEDRFEDSPPNGRRRPPNDQPPPGPPPKPPVEEA